MQGGDLFQLALEEEAVDVEDDLDLLCLGGTVVYDQHAGDVDLGGHASSLIRNAML